MALPPRDPDDRRSSALPRDTSDASSPRRNPARPPLTRRAGSSGDGPRRDFTGGARRNASSGGDTSGRPRSGSRDAADRRGQSASPSARQSGASGAAGGRGRPSAPRSASAGRGGVEGRSFPPRGTGDDRGDRRERPSSTTREGGRDSAFRGEARGPRAGGSFRDDSRGARDDSRGRPTTSSRGVSTGRGAPRGASSSAPGRPTRDTLAVPGRRREQFSEDRPSRVARDGSEYRIPTRRNMPRSPGFGAGRPVVPGGGRPGAGDRRPVEWVPGASRPRPQVDRTPGSGPIRRRDVDQGLRDDDRLGRHGAPRGASSDRAPRPGSRTPRTGDRRGAGAVPSGRDGEFQRNLGRAAQAGWGGVARRGAGALSDQDEPETQFARRDGAVRRDAASPAAPQRREPQARFAIKASGAKRPNSQRGTASAARAVAPDSAPVRRKRKREVPFDVSSELRQAAAPRDVARVELRLADAARAYDRERYTDALPTLRDLVKAAPGASSVRELL